MIPASLSTTLRVLLAPALASLAGAQSFNFPDFASTAGLALNPTAAQVGNVLRITPAAISARGSFYWDQQVSVAGGFDTTFTFQIGNPSGGGADGMAFVVHADPRGTTALGNHASAMGYGAFVGAPAGTAIASSLVVEIDTWLNGAPWNDSSANEISIHTGGAGDNSQDEAFSLGRVTPAVDMSDGQVHTMRILYVANPGTIEVYLDDPTTPVLTAAYNLVSGGTLASGSPVGGLGLGLLGVAYVGFTAGNGGSWEEHDVLSWDWSYPTVIVPDPMCMPLTNSAGSAATITLAPTVAGAPVDGTVAGGVPGQFGYFISGPNSGLYINPPGSTGIICIAAPQYRYNSTALGMLFVFDANGDSKPIGAMGPGPQPVSLPTDGSFGGVPAVMAGDTRAFQAWYRDVAPFNSNFSDALRVMFN